MSRLISVVIRDTAQPDADRMESVKPIEDLRFGSCKRCLMQVGRDSTLLPDASSFGLLFIPTTPGALTSASVRAALPTAAASLISRRRTLLSGPISKKRANPTSLADYPLALHLRYQLSHDDRAIRCRTITYRHSPRWRNGYPMVPFQQQIADCNLTLRSLAHGTSTYHRSMAIDTANHQRSFLHRGLRPGGVSPSSVR